MPQYPTACVGEKPLDPVGSCKAVATALSTGCGARICWPPSRRHPRECKGNSEVPQSIDILAAESGTPAHEHNVTLGLVGHSDVQDVIILPLVLAAQ
eukprot:6242741-Amphidinium_carterae.1